MDEKKLIFYALVNHLGAFVKKLNAEDIECVIYAENLLRFERIRGCDYAALSEDYAPGEDREIVLKILRSLDKLYGYESEFSVSFVKKSAGWKEVFALADLLRANAARSSEEK